LNNVSDIYDYASEEDEYPDQQKDEEREESDPEDDTLEGVQMISSSSSDDDSEEEDEERKLNRRIRRRDALIRRFAHHIASPQEDAEIIAKVTEQNAIAEPEENSENAKGDSDTSKLHKSAAQPPPEFETLYLPIIHQKNKTGFEEANDFPITVGTVIAGRYQIVEYLGSAAFSRAVQCLDLQTNQLVCVKIIKNNKDFFDQSLDEIKLLRYINTHGDPDENNVVQLFEYFYFKEHLFLVFELLRDDLYEFSQYNRSSGEEVYFTVERLQSICRQVSEALKYINSLNLIHCDLKPEVRI
jgi:hypothetical protein